MATIQDYVSGKVCDQIKIAFSIFETSEGSLKDMDIGKVMLNNVDPLKPKKITVEEAMGLIQQSEQCAIGERVCRSVHQETPLTESVFLNELAVGMVEAGKARFVNKNGAMENIRKYRKNPIIVSKVSGVYSEICPTWPKKCLYWNMERRQLKCINT